MAESVFNAESFLTTEVSGSLDTHVIPVPEGDRPAQITDVKGRSITSKDGTNGAVLDITYLMLDEESKKVTARDLPTARQTIFLDITDKGALDMGKGKNVQLGKLRDALGQNTPKPWNPRQLLNSRVTAKIKHTPDKNDPDIKYANVVSVAAA